jgi:hypothetical protein
MLFPDGIYYNREFDEVRTSRINSFFSLIPEIAKVIGGHKKRDSIKNDKIPALVNPTVQNSNHLISDLKSLGEILTA